MGLKLAGGQNNKPGYNEPWDAGMEEDDNPWDNPPELPSDDDDDVPWMEEDDQSMSRWGDVEERPTVSLAKSEEAIRMENTKGKRKPKGGGGTLLIVSGVVVYFMTAILYIMLLMAMRGVPVDIYSDAMGLKTYALLVAGVVLLDFIFVCIFVGFDISALLLAFIFQPLYPLRRDKVTGTIGYGGIVALIGIASIGLFSFNLFTSMSKYTPGIVKSTNESTRHLYADFADAPCEGSKRYRTALDEIVDVTAAEVSNTSGVTQIVVTGNSKTGLEEGDTSSGAPVQLVFKKASGSYTLTKLVFDGKTATKRDMQGYWKKAIGEY